MNQPAADDGATALYLAYQEGHAKVVEKLLAHGVNADLATSEVGSSPLYVASAEGYVDVVEMLLSKGADVNQPGTDDGTTALYFASQEGQSRESRGEAPRARGKSKPRHLGRRKDTAACCVRNGHADIVECCSTRVLT